MRPHLIGSLAIAFVAACGNGPESRTPVSRDTTTGGVEQGSLPTDDTTRTTGNEQSTSAQTQGVTGRTGQPLPNAGARAEAAAPGRTPRPIPPLEVTPVPHPVNTGDPCGPCAPPPPR